MSKLKNWFFGGELWQRNLRILWFGAFMTGIGASIVSPFLSLFIDSLGNFTHKELSFDSGIIFASTYLMTAIVSPFWGKLADQKGRKPMLIRASLGMAITIFLMAFVTSIWQLLVLRMLLGAFSGFTSNSIALMAIITPKEKSGQVLGTLSTGTVAGTLLGPIVGGMIVAHTSYRAAFALTGSIMFLVFLLTVFFVKEKFEPKKKTDILPARDMLKKITSPNIVIGMLFTTMILQLTDKSISPILSLYVRELVSNSQMVTIFSGIVASAPGLVMIFVAPLFGRLGDKIGQYKILFIGISVSLIIYLLLGFTTNIWQVIILRLFIGVSDAALAPSVQIILSRNTPIEATGRIFSYNQTMQSIGAVIGPLAGSAIAASFDYRMVFFFAVICIIFNLINYGTNFKHLKIQN
ncbi:multidrug transporter [Enterococcus hermanniensis]|uniref:Multidrug transporter n=1 Tax=Enterococcus hermanniensis TaxID=249189 RepID=A0A1L8TPW2_9ENTE|nr:MFS transporter [Enterococcus hermanniensis]OJG46114.1 multidrug transporter [Enterococcus hermanniensis]